MRPEKRNLAQHIYTATEERGCLRTLQAQPLGLYEATQATRTNFSEYSPDPIFQGLKVCRWNLNTLGIYRVRKRESGDKGGKEAELVR